MLAFLRVALSDSIPPEIYACIMTVVLSGPSFSADWPYLSNLRTAQIAKRSKNSLRVKA